MNTTNLITDYIISGILGLLTFLIPLYMLDASIVTSILSTELKNETVLAIIMTIIGYAFGVVFNQFADWIEDLFYSLFRITMVKDAQTKVYTDCGLDHHYALQLVVAESETAYDYISFRRTMIRIIRALLCLFILVPFIHILIAVIFKISGRNLTFSFPNLLIIFLCFFLTLVLYKFLKKTYKGYYAAITNFALIIKNRH